MTGFINPPPGTFDRIVRSQAEFDTLIASPTWLDAKSVLFVGDGGTLKFQHQGGIKIPDTVRSIRGIQVATISSNSLAAGVAALAYASLPADTIPCVIEGLTISVTSSSMNGNAAYGFRYCRNLTNCYCQGTSGDVVAFSDCDNLVNCRAEVKSTNYAYGFKGCSNLSNCRSKTTARTTSFAFTGCHRLVNCQGVGIRPGSVTGVAVGPDDIVTYDSGIDEVTTGAYAFHNCDYLNNCSRYDQASSTGFLGGTNTKVDTLTVVAS